MNKKRLTILSICAALTLTACGGSGIGGDSGIGGITRGGNRVEAKISEPPSGAPQTISLKRNVDAPGTVEERNDVAVIDYSHTEDGYVMMQYTEMTDLKLKAQVKGPETTYTYNLEPQVWAAFPLSDGDGYYQFSVFENVADSKYALVLDTDCEVEMSDEFAPFLRPNQFVDYADAPLAVATAKELAYDETLDTVCSVYDFVTSYLSYDKEKAATVQSGYLPVLDRTLEEKQGICFDYASLMTGMLRSLGIPCRLVVGYAGDAYHAWISVWSEDEGWIDDIIYFDGTNWQRMDPTFASAGRAANEFIGNGDNYLAKYFY